MKLLRKLPSIETVSKNGIARTRTMGLFLCPVCNKEVEKDLNNGKRVATCGKGCKDNGCTTHGHSKTAPTSIYTVWANIKRRCTDVNSPAYQFYGAKGISYDPLWEKFEGFLKDMEDGYRPGLTIDRIDPKGNYCKENCQWITKSENSSKDKLKPIAKYSIDGDLLEIYPSVISAAEKENIKFPGSIARVARGERSSYKGFVWKYMQTVDTTTTT